MYRHTTRTKQSEHRPGTGKFRTLLVAAAVVILAGSITTYALETNRPAQQPSRAVLMTQTNKSSAPKPTTVTTKMPTTKVAAAPQTTACSGNTLSQNIIVSISARHLWACDDALVLYDSPVVTGMEMYAADLTPTGVYHIYGKVRNTVLNGSDSTGSWSDPVSYWMPFLDNQYGAYGLHDATWRAADEFGNISPDSTNASHGCVELPLATAAWIYNWAVIGTTVTINA